MIKVRKYIPIVECWGDDTRTQYVGSISYNTTLEAWHSHDSITNCVVLDVIPVDIVWDNKNCQALSVEDCKAILEGLKEDFNKATIAANTDYPESAEDPTYQTRVNIRTYLYDIGIGIENLEKLFKKIFNKS